ncbi:MAG TPA: alpha/beta hydrolase family protein, partial [Victivallales bacterium]|nr:alpha/beta hydrolase family protein [Victivallales bacterium]
MALIQCEFFSEVLGLSSSMNVILPQNVNIPFGINAKKIHNVPPVLYLFHGYSDNHSVWMRRTSIERYAVEAGIAVVMPAVNLSFYTDMIHGNKYWTFISEELPKIVHSFFKLSTKRSETFVAGLSMGGYGAFKLALSKPENYAAAGSFSGALDVYSLCKAADVSEKIKSLYNIFDDPEIILNTQRDLYWLVRKLNEKKLWKRKFPKLFQCCGTEDFLYKDNIRFRDYLRENNNFDF